MGMEVIDIPQKPYIIGSVKISYTIFTKTNTGILRGGVQVPTGGIVRDHLRVNESVTRVREFRYRQYSLDVRRSIFFECAKAPDRMIRGFLS